MNAALQCLNSAVLFREHFLQGEHYFQLFYCGLSEQYFSCDLL